MGEHHPNGEASGTVPADGLDTAFGGATTGVMALASFFMVAMMFHVVADVLSKWLFNFPLIGTLEVVSNYYMVGLIFLPLAYVQRKGSHIVAEIFTQNMAWRARLFLDGAIGIFLAVYAAAFVWHTSVEGFRKTVELEYLEATGVLIVIWPVRWFLPVGFGIMGLMALYQAVRGLRQALRDKPDGAAG
ncbi:MAG: hypothetical protein CMM10_09640 [Rhodospirillaceae bacterium]|nr:hypothetical protein [Rhodospirillaceae bacterium]MDP6644286.1 TRAP transporter small permease [Rhodospirillales bacterium]